MKAIFEATTIATLALMTAGCCIGVSAAAGGPCQAGNASSAAQPASAAGGSECANGDQIAADGMLDDFEDGDTQLTVEGGRDGYWWKASDPNGSVIEPEELKPVSGGADGSAMAMMVKGKTSSSEGAWGASLGVNFSSSGVIDASKYKGITFKAKAGEGARKIRVKVGDVNTHQDLGVCTECWNHFGTDIRLTDKWKQYTIYFDKLKQAPGWGAPRPASIAQNELYSLDFSFAPGMEFEFWVDDLAFVECKP